MGRYWLVGACLLASGCVSVGFGRKVTTDELVLRQEVEAYYNDVQRAFAAGNPDALSSLFSPSITKPMTLPEIRAWSQKFFSENGRASFKIEKLEFESLGFSDASVVLTYSVRTSGGKGDFSGIERNILVKRNGRWFTASWERLSP
ncbi:MAG: nuclear transport factor 2 family protein [Elusimicrobia bacterium]|nr:nuclear transport factor 2 family protein [Elusimicrobiota bacterium]